MRPRRDISLEATIFNFHTFRNVFGTYPVDLRPSNSRFFEGVGQKGADLMTRRPQNGLDKTDGRTKWRSGKKTLLKTNYSIVFGVCVNFFSLKDFFLSFYPRPPHDDDDDDDADDDT